MLIERKRKRRGDSHRCGHDRRWRKNGADAKNARSRNVSFGNGSPQCENNLGITGGAHVAHGSETGAKRDCRIVSRIETDLGIRILNLA